MAEELLLLRIYLTPEAFNELLKTRSTPDQAKFCLKVLVWQY